MTNAMGELHRAHTERETQRKKTKGPILLVGLLLVVGSLLVAYLVGAEKVGKASQLKTELRPIFYVIAGCGIGLAILWSLSAQLLAEWDRAVVLRLGHFRAVSGPGFFMIVPFIDSVVRIVDMRVRTTPFYGESMLTKDTVPVNVDAIAFWHIWDSQKAVLEVENYYQAIVMAVQTALRDIVGLHSLAEVLSEREKIAQTLEHVFQKKMQAWGMSVSSLELRDITIPAELKDALSKQAQAERERQARSILGQAEMELAAKFAEAAKGYADNPVALQLRAMNIVYEGLRAGGSMMLVPSSILDTMNLGSLGAMGMQMRQKPRPVAQVSEENSEEA